MSLQDYVIAVDSSSTINTTSAAPAAGGKTTTAPTTTTGTLYYNSLLYTYTYIHRTNFNIVILLPLLLQQLTMHY